MVAVSVAGAQYRTSDVFVTGGLPIHTYVQRHELQLEEKLNSYLENRHKLLTITGATKTGKTVLVRRRLPRDANIWIPGGSVTQEQEFWLLILDKCPSGATAQSIASTTGAEQGSSAGADLQLTFATVVATKASLGVSDKDQSSATASWSREVSPKVAALSALERERKPLVIDDFHLMPRAVQGAIVRALKDLVFEGLPVIALAVPHRRYDAVRVEHEMTGRVEHMPMPPWQLTELEQIPRRGFPLLNAHCPDGAMDTMSREAFGSPHLMQAFCARLAQRSGIHETVGCPCEIAVPAQWQEFFYEEAHAMARPMYTKFKTGARQRTDRIPRTLAGGEKTDIYGVVLRAIAQASATHRSEITYDAIKSTIKTLVVDATPGMHEVTRVLEKMTEIAKEIAQSDAQSSPALEWDSDLKVLHITDPFFAFYLRHGAQHDDVAVS